ncbi:MAG: hypothetical protein RLY20_1385 [Verrucomicrobiota bacterium]
MTRAIPFADTDRRSAVLRGTLLLATLLGLMASTPVWLNRHTFPQLPLFHSFPALPAPWDGMYFIAMLLTLVAAAWFYRPGVIAFLALCLIAYCGDQNRAQPWLYMYWMMLLLTLLPKDTALAACRWAFVVVYLWGGIQKCNATFFAKVPAWFVSPAADKWHLPAFAVDALRLAVASGPFLEIAFGISLWFALTRRVTLVLITMLHVVVLVLLGPLGHDYNWVVWPWNLAMIALAWALFPTKPPERAPSLLNASLAQLRASRLALVVLLPFTLLPILNYSGRWDSAFSFALYSESNASANIFVTQRFVDALPPKLRTYAIPFPNYDPQHQGPFLFNFAPWAYEEMRVPSLSEPRNFRNIFQSLRRYATQPEDLRMIVGERGGRVMFYQDDTVWPLQAK